LNEMQLMEDWFAGLGGASEAFIQDPNWQVLRYDNNPLLANVPGMTMLDLLDVDLEKYRNNMRHPVKLFWASPECKDFSLGYASPRSKAHRAGEDYKPDMRQLEKCIEYIGIMKPQYYVIENVRGAIKYFKPYLGEPQQIINGSIFLWGRFPKIHLPRDYNHTKDKADLWSTDPMRYNAKSLIPFEVSNGLKKAIQEQKLITNF